jgi:hypothetical protein
LNIGEHVVAREIQSPWWKVVAKSGGDKSEYKGRKKEEK